MTKFYMMLLSLFGVDTVDKILRGIEADVQKLRDAAATKHANASAHHQAALTHMQLADEHSSSALKALTAASNISKAL